eukprot:1732350-Rhodomonas_salina.2
MPGTDIAHVAISLPARYAVSGTDVAYAGTRQPARGASFSGVLTAALFVLFVIAMGVGDCDVLLKTLSDG